MHKKMLRVAARAQTLGKKVNIPPEVWDNLWAGQCNDPYWHGVFGGLYLPNLRFPVYRNLLHAEAKLDELEKLPAVRIEETDFDCDGANEILVESNEMNLYLKPQSGGCLVELDYKPIAYNLLDILSRREEGYHRRLMAKGGQLEDSASVHDSVLVKELGLEKHLHFDWYRHASLVDHFFGGETTLEGFSQCKYPEIGDFINQPYTWRTLRQKDGVEVTLERQGALWRDGKPHGVTVRKRIKYKPGSGCYSAGYTLVNRESIPVDLWFGVEFSIGLMAGDAHDRYYRIDGRKLAQNRLKSIGEEKDVDGISVVDEWLGIETALAFDKPSTLWRCPIETVSLSEAGFEKLYQCSLIVPHWKIRLETEFHVQLKQSIARR